MTKSTKRFSVRSLLLVVAAIAVLLALAIPAYERAMAPELTDQQCTVTRSNTIFPVVSVNAFFSENSYDRPRILLLHRRTKEVPSEKWLPKWFQPTQTAAGQPHYVGGTPQYLTINGESLYPRKGSNIAVVYATDDGTPIITWVPHSEYSSLGALQASGETAEGARNDTSLLWEKMVDKRRANGT